MHYTGPEETPYVIDMYGDGLVNPTVLQLHVTTGNENWPFQEDMGIVQKMMLEELLNGHLM